MQVLVRDRQEGKTSALIAWLVRGKPTREYPGWNRVIVCVTSQEVVRVTRLVGELTESIVGNYEWSYEMSVFLWRQYATRVGEPRILHDLRKCVWSLDDLKNGYGYTDMEYAIDDVDRLIMYNLGLLAPPAIVTMTGKIYDGK